MAAVCKIELKSAKENMQALYYSNTLDTQQQNALVGYLRMDFGRTGEEFWSTWFPNNESLRTVKFANTLDNVINDLRKRGKLLYNRSAMYKNVQANGNLTYVELGEFLFCFRSKPQVGGYDCYCYCFDKQLL